MIENLKRTEKNSEANSWFFEKINLTNLNQIKQKRKNTQITKIRNKRGDITIDATEKIRFNKFLDKWIKFWKNKTYQDGIMKKFKNLKKYNQ